MTRICFVARPASGASELLSAVAAEARSLGADVGFAGRGFPSVDEPAVYVFSPSDLAGDRRGEGMPSASQLGRSIALCAETPGTERFERSAALSRRAGATMDISTPALAEHRRRGTVAERFALGYAAAWDRWGDDPESERTIDVLFTGSPTDRRQSALAASAEFLTRFRFCVATDPSPLHAKARLEQLRESHVVLAIHRDARPYFDWLLAIHAICNGAVLISEHACDFGPLVPSEHFVSARADDLGLLAAQMLRDEGQMSEMRRNAYEFVRRELTMRRSVEHLLGIAEELCARPARARSFRAKRSRRRALAPSLPCGDSRLAAPSSPPLEPVPRPAQGAASGPPESDAQLRFLRATPVYWQAGTELSVCIAPCEDALEAVAALESIAASEGALPEVLLVVDPAAEDRLEPLEEWLLSHLWLPVLLLGRTASRALAAHELVAHARSSYVWMMEARDAPYPLALERLRSALERDAGAMSAHGIVDHRSSDGTRRLLWSSAWEPSRFHGAAAPQRMALVRREAALLARSGDPGHRRILVPEVLCRSAYA